MTRFTSRLDEGTNVPLMYERAIWQDSRLWPGVQFQVLRMSLLRRHRLMHEIRPLATEEAFRWAAPDDAGSEITATELQTRIEEIVLRTALLKIKGLNIDGEPATVESLIEGGPESLAREIAEAIAKESSLDENERKN